MDRYDPKCPGCGRLMSEHEGGIAFTRFYDELHSMATHELGMPSEEAHKAVRVVLDLVLYRRDGQGNAALIANMTTGEHFWVGLYGDQIFVTPIVVAPKELMDTLRKSIELQDVLSQSYAKEFYAPKENVFKRLRRKFQRTDAKLMKIDELIASDKNLKRVQEKAHLN